MSKLVWVDGVIPFDGEPVANRIFRNRKAALIAFTSRAVFQMDRTVAVKSIRHQLWLRSHGVCDLCGSPINEQTCHMHEQKHRGRGGEISLDNSVMICVKCHKYAHRDRNPRWGAQGE